MSTHNGFVLNYDGPFFPATGSNRITYDCFCFMGGLSNGRLTKVQHKNGAEIYYTYHRIDKR
jgi:hypothetical protein